MKKLVVFPSDPIEDYIEVGSTYEYLEDYFNPGGYFDEVYGLSIWGEKEEQKYGKITYIKCQAKNMHKSFLYTLNSEGKQP